MNGKLFICLVLGLPAVLFSSCAFAPLRNFLYGADFYTWGAVNAKRIEIYAYSQNFSTAYRAFFCIRISSFKTNCDDLYIATEGDTLPGAGTFHGSIVRLSNSEAAITDATTVWILDTDTGTFLNKAKKKKFMGASSLDSQIEQGIELGRFSLADGKLRYCESGRSRCRGRRER